MRLISTLMQMFTPDPVGGEATQQVVYPVKGPDQRISRLVMKMKRLLYWLIIFPLLATALLPATPVQAQGTEILKPTAYTFSAAGTNDNPEWAYDKTTAGDNTTYNRLGVGNNNNETTIEYHTWQTLSYTHTARRLYIRRSGTGNTNDTWGIHYSTDNGTIYNPIEIDLLNPAEGNTTAVTIDTGLDLSSLWVKISTGKASQPDGGFADIWDVWLEGDYAEPPDILNTPNNYAFGILSASSTTETGLTYFTVTNNSAFNVNITIGGADMTGGTTWTLSDTATPGSDTYGLYAGLEGGSYNVIVRKTPTFNILVPNLAGGGTTQSWGLQLLAPTSFSDGASKSGTVTLTATQA